MQIAPSLAAYKIVPSSPRLSLGSTVDSQNGSCGNKSQRRKISYQEGHALEILGHAIEYLADEYALECRSRNAVNHAKTGPVQAIELLMARSREIYLAGEPVPTFAERVRLWLGFARA
jgi:hypothetical protein